MGTFYQIRLFSGTNEKNFPISLDSLSVLPFKIMFNSGHLDIDLFAFTGADYAKDSNENNKIQNKFRLLIKLFVDYRLNLEKLEPKQMNLEHIRHSGNALNGKVMNFDESKYMESNIDSAQTDLLEFLDELAQNRLKSAIPSLVNWSDANISKNSSGFCDVRNAYAHADLQETSKKKLLDKFPDMEFNPDGSIDRNSGINFNNLSNIVDPLLREIKNGFIKKYLSGQELPFNILWK